MLVGLSLVGISWAFMPGDECVYGVDTGEMYGSVGTASASGNGSVEVVCPVQEQGLDLSKGLSIVVVPGGHLTLCPRDVPFGGSPLRVLGAVVSIHGDSGDDVIIETGGQSVVVAEGASLTLEKVQVDGFGYACGVTTTTTTIDFWSGYTGTGYGVDPLRNAPMLDVQGELVLVDGMVQNGLGGFAGAAFVTGRLTTTGTTFAYNRSVDGGGALRVSGGSVELNGTTFEVNEAFNGPGGAVLVEGGATGVVLDSSFSWNQARRHGGAIHVADGELDILDSTFDGNSVSAPFGYYPSTGDPYADYGAALAVGDGSVVERSTFVGNHGAGALKVLTAADVDLLGLLFSDNHPSGGPADLLVDWDADVTAKGLAMCQGFGWGPRIEIYDGGSVEIDGLYAYGADLVAQGKGELDLDHATAVLAFTGAAVFATDTTLTRSIIDAPGYFPGAEFSASSSLLHLAGPPWSGADLLHGAPAWVVPSPADTSAPGNGALGCSPESHRPYPGTAGTFPLGTDPDPSDPSDDWGAWAADAERWSEALGIDVLADGDGDGAVWAYDCADDDEHRSALHDEVCSEVDVDENCDGVVGTPGGAETDWQVDADLDGLVDLFLSCQEPPWSIDGTAPRDCDDHDPEAGEARPRWVDGDGDGVPSQHFVCDDAGDATYEGEPDCDDEDAEVWRMVVVLVDGDDDGVPGDPIDADIGCVGTVELELPGQYDCDDGDKLRYPGAVDTPDDGIDQDCDGREATSFAIGGCTTAAASAPSLAWITRRR